MALNFRLAYTDSIRYIDLFPDTALEAITDIGNNLYKISTKQVYIPPASANTQNVSITVTASQASSVVRMYLVTQGEQAEFDYGTISQFSVSTNQLTITRLYDFPVSPITVNLVFFEKVVPDV